MSDRSPFEGLFEESVAIVTGSTRGIGAGIAKRLAAAGASVVVSGRTESDGRALVSEIRDGGGDAMFVAADVRSSEDLDALVQATLDQYDRLDILVNNAAFETDTRPDEIDLETWDAILETDFRAYWLAAKYAYPALAASDRGAIVNVGSNHSSATQPKKFPYNAIKSGIDGMTRAMAVAWGEDGIRVNSVNPGWTMVDRIDEDLSESDLRELEQIHPLGRIGTPADVADAVLFLASDMARFVTGECLVVDGGRTAILQDDLYLDDHRQDPKNIN
jgi:NAD(P)-dependent dehydrogenase (short-subunit alcohol dehydrogenase family)